MSVVSTGETVKSVRSSSGSSVSRRNRRWLEMLADCVLPERRRERVFDAARRREGKRNDDMSTLLIEKVPRRGYCPYCGGIRCSRV